MWPDNQRCLEIAIQAAKEAGALILAQRAQPLNLIPKGYRDWATNADLAAQNLTIEIISRAFPDHHFLAEENTLGQFPSNGDGDSTAPVWIIDPLDGTSNYTRGMSNFAVSIAFAVDMAVQVGVVYDPVHDELFTAVLNNGGYCNGRPLQTNPVTQLSEAILCLDWGRSFEQRQHTITILQNLIHQVRTIRALGSAALAMCWIADGRLDAYYNCNMKIWDIAAAGLILSEAGGKIGDSKGHMWDLDQEQTWRISSTPQIYRELVSHLLTSKESSIV